MTSALIKTPFRLRRVATPLTTAALWFPRDEVEELLRLCAAVEPRGWPKVFRLAEGFLICLGQTTDQTIPGTLRLRQLAANLFIPADAELLPALRDDERQALVRERGLVFLPHDQVLGFRANETIALAELLHLAVSRQTWETLPDPPHVAEALTRIVEEEPDPPVEEVLEAGGEDIGVEQPRPPETTLPRRVAGGAAVGLGQALTWFGQTFGLGGVARAGMRLLDQGMSLAPRLSEGLLGRQEAALRELLRQFKLGHIDDALRRALPLDAPPERGGAPDQGWRLPWHNLGYSLSNLFGSSRGPAGYWYIGGDVRQALADEYRRQAQLAVQRGDYRRAAFIWGKLLNDFRQAARVLSDGGLFHDAAIIYLKKLNDPLAAAQAFESAGKLERALELYRQVGEHGRAGDLLRRAGAEEEAIAEYHLAAAQIIARRRDYLLAGDLMQQRAGRADLALEYWREGWRLRGQFASLPCAERLASIWTDHGAVSELRSLLAEAESFLAAQGSDIEAGSFFNVMARLAERPELSRVRDEFHDRALVGTTDRLRKRVRAGQVASAILGTMLPSKSAWSPALVSDAAYAVRAAQRGLAVKSKVGKEYPTIVLPAATPAVSAAVCVPATGEIFVGFASGEIVRYDPRNGDVETLPRGGVTAGGTFVIDRGTSPTEVAVGPGICSLAVSAFGNCLVTLQRTSRSRVLIFYERHQLGHYTIACEDSKPLEEYAWLSPNIAHGEVTETVLGTALSLTHFRGRGLTCMRELRLEEWETTAVTGLLLNALRADWRPGGVLWFGQQEVGWCDWWIGSPATFQRAHLGWTPQAPNSSAVEVPPLAWLPSKAAEIEIVGLAAQQQLGWARLSWSEGKLTVAASQLHGSQAGPYSAVTLVRAETMAALHSKGIDWLRVRSGHIELTSTTDVSWSQPVACFPHVLGQQLLVVTRDGAVVRVPFSGR